MRIWVVHLGLNLFDLFFRSSVKILGFKNRLLIGWTLLNIVNKLEPEYERIYNLLKSRKKRIQCRQRVWKYQPKEKERMTLFWKICWHQLVRHWGITFRGLGVSDTRYAGRKDSYTAVSGRSVKHTKNGTKGQGEAKFSRIKILNNQSLFERSLEKCKNTKQFSLYCLN